MNFAKPTVASTNGAASSMSHSTIQHPPKSSGAFKEVIPASGFPSHAASRATAKKGFFGRETGASMVQSSVKASTAQLQTKDQAFAESSGRDSKTSKN